MTVFLVTDINDNQKYNYSLFENLGKYDIDKNLLVIGSPQAADIILFSTLGLNDNEILNIPRHPLVKACYLICDRDKPYPVLPGLYTALPKLKFVSFKAWHKYFSSIFYLAGHNPYIRELRDIHQDKPVYLFSFTGSLTSRVRKKLFALTLKRTDVLIKKTQTNIFWENFFWVTGIKETVENREYLISYAKEILKSKFILCPKGNGNSSYRFFEVMEAGRVPVLISDNYVLPDIPYNWDDIVIRIAENNVARTEEIISSNEHRFEQMALLNRKVYEECFLNKSRFIYQNFERLKDQKPLTKNRNYALFLLYWVGMFKSVYNVKKLHRSLFNVLATFKKKFV